jgi:hypothetical protein
MTFKAIVNDFFRTVVRRATSLPKITGYYNLLGIQLPKEPESGVYIIKYDDGTAEKVMK